MGSKILFGCARGVDAVTPGAWQRDDAPCEASEATLLPEPQSAAMMSGDPGAELAMMVIESAKEDKKFGRAMRAAEERAQEAAERAQLAAMAEKADDAFEAGLVSGATMAVSGLISMGGANAAEKSDRNALGVQGTTRFVEAGGKLGSSAFQHDADDANTEATRQEQVAGRHKRKVDDARDDVKDAKALIDRAINFYKEYTTAKADAQRAALMRA